MTPDAGQREFTVIVRRSASRGRSGGRLIRKTLSDWENIRQPSWMGFSACEATAAISTTSPRISRTVVGPRLLMSQPTSGAQWAAASSETFIHDHASERRLRPASRQSHGLLELSGVATAGLG